MLHYLINSAVMGDNVDALKSMTQCDNIDIDKIVFDACKYGKLNVFRKYANINGIASATAFVELCINQATSHRRWNIVIDMMTRAPYRCQYLADRALYYCDITIFDVACGLMPEYMDNAVYKVARNGNNPMDRTVSNKIFMSQTLRIITNEHVTITLHNITPEQTVWLYRNGCDDIIDLFYGCFASDTNELPAIVSALLLDERVLFRKMRRLANYIHNSGKSNDKIIDEILSCQL